MLAVINGVLALLGRPIDTSVLPERLVGWIVGTAAIGLVGGGLEELGWRHFALPRLQLRLSPLKASMLLGLVWGIWHVPAYGTPVAVVVPFVLAALYTWLYNASGSVLLCVVLHGNITASLDRLLLTADSSLVDLVIFATYAVAALSVVVLTRGRLGYRHTQGEDRDGANDRGVDEKDDQRAGHG